MSSSVTGAASAAASIDPSDPRWDRFVEDHPQAVAYHLGAWAPILRAAYGFRPAYLALEGDGGLRAVMPLMRSRGLLSGVRLRSLPIIPTAGPLGETRADEAELVRAALRLAQESGAGFGVQSRFGGYCDLVDGLEVEPRHPAWVTPLPGDPDELRATWRKTSKNLHRSLNKAERSGLQVREGRSKEDLRAFYDLYLATMKAHKVLPRAYGQLSNARDRLGERGVFRLFIAEHEGRVVAGGVFHAFNGAVELLYNGSDSAALDLRPNHALYWHAIRWAIGTGHASFDWGTAKPDSSLERFKAQWSAEPLPEYHYSAQKVGGAERAANLREAGDRLGRAGGASRREQLVARVWERAPLGATRLAGSVAYRLL